jgi:hypothetical protein
VAKIPGGTVLSLIRRVITAFGLAAAIASFVRLRGTGGVPPQTGGWRELTGPDFR